VSGPPPKAILTGLGALTAVGLTAAQTAAALRASIARLGELEEVFDDAGEPVVAAPVPLKGPRRVDRLTWLCWRATGEAMNAAGLTRTDDVKPPVAVLLALPEANRPDRRDGPPTPRWEALEPAFARRVQVRHRETVAAGHAAVFLALARAMELFDQGVCTTAVIAAADSLVTTPALDWLDGQKRLKAAYAPKGFVPGEAAAALVVEKGPRPARPGARVWARCHAVASAREPVGMDADEPALAKGLTEALHGALEKAKMGPRDVEVVLCDLNGEPYRANDWCLARNRVLGRAGDLNVLHPADCLGDTGAAAGAILGVLAGIGFVRHYWSCPRLLLWSAADTGERAALCLAQPENGVPERG
jgi:3-oxoacyl-[acyl-carrier-protein] synthase-1